MISRVPTFIVLTAVFFLVTALLAPAPHLQPPPVEEDDNPQARAEQEFIMLRDPVTGQIPDRIFELEQEFARKLPKRQEYVLAKTGIVRNTAALTWTERGPINVGGRTRALGIDVRTTSPPNVTIVAGGISGGIWRSTNDGASWALTTTAGQLHNVSCIVQDTRPGKRDIWYAGSGEASGNSASATGASYRGDGIFKSTDNGLTWTQIPSTVSNSPQSFISPFQYITNFAVDTSNQSADILYAAAATTVQRSSNGGTSWTQVLGTLQFSNWSEVQVDSGGVVYAALPSNSTSPGIWRSPDGVTWTNISSGVSGFPTSYSRIVIGLAPSNANVVYFLIQATNGTNGVNQINNHQLWKYSYVSGNGSGAGGTWANRGANLPSLAFPNEPFDSQGGYDLMCRVKPDNGDFLVIGGTNLYRSTDAFASTTNTDRIGGYDPNFTNGLYPNNHPDQHAGVFLPGSSIRFYNGNDGGLAVTTDITATLGGNNPVAWASLNNGYNVTQFYGIALAPESGSDFMVAGTQDNGNRIGNSPGASSWALSPEGGDGTFTAVAPLADNRYYSATQFGNLRSYQRDLTFIQQFYPNPSYNVLFVNPFVLDPNNSSILYYAAGNLPSNAGVWRNDSAKSITPSSHWTFLTTTIQSFIVSALGLSTSSSPNVLYFGTTNGQVFRTDNASTGSSPAVTNITGSLPGGYVNCIAVDPTNSNNALLVFSNYNIQSLWYTTNGGTNWTDEEGNLAGASGPSIRWAKIFYVGGVSHYFLGASTGIYFSTALNGVSTVWTQEATTSIGNVVVDMLAYRPSDGTLAAATHGRGVFTSTVSSPLPVQIATFIAVPQPTGGVRLEWATVSETNNYGFTVQRRSNSEKDFRDLPGSFVSGQGTTIEPHQYSYFDRLVTPGDWYYRLRQTDADGASHMTDAAKVHVDVAVPQTTALGQNYPNPFNPMTRIEYTVAEASHITMKVFDMTGREVVALVDGQIEPGRYQATFDGSRYASGMYIVRLTSGGKREIRKMLLMK
jgi:hypothetical protein